MTTITSWTATLDREQALHNARNLAKDIGRKFEAVDMDAELIAAAELYVIQYEEDERLNRRPVFSFLSDMVMALARYKGLTEGQAKGVLNCLRADMLREPQTAAAPVAMAEDGKHQVRNGTYTVILNGDDDYVTLKIRDAKFAKDMPKGTQMACYLSGADNAGDFTGFAFVQGRTGKVWKRFQQDGRLAQALKVLLDGGDADAGERYAMASGTCYCCGRKLTVPASLHRGLGPICAERGY